MKAMLIYNPAAGQRDLERQVRKALTYLEERDWEILWRKTRGSGDATTHAREAVDIGCDVVIVAGGDGTIGQAVNGLAGSPTALAVLPVGTTNVWAREVGIPLPSPLRPHALLDAVKIVAEGERQCVDLGMVNDRYFLMWVGIGFDAEVTAQVESQPAIKRRLGKAFFVAAVIAQWLRLSGTRTYINIDGRKMRGRVLMVVAANIQLYAGIIRLAPTANMTDGLLEVCVFKGYTSLEAYRHFFSVLLGLHTRDPEVQYHRAKRLTVATSKPIPVHADGEIIGTTPVEIRIAPRCLNIVIPSSGAADQSTRRANLVPEEVVFPWQMWQALRRTR